MLRPPTFAAIAALSNKNATLSPRTNGICLMFGSPGWRYKSLAEAEFLSLGLLFGGSWVIAGKAGSYPSVIASKADVSAVARREGGSNPDCLIGSTLDCFVAYAPRNDGDAI